MGEMLQKGLNVLKHSDVVQIGAVLLAGAGAVIAGYNIDRSPEKIGYIETPFLDLPQVYAESLPPKLPLAVRAEADSALKVFYNAQFHTSWRRAGRHSITKTTTESDDSGSAVKIGKDTIVTAGHLIDQKHLFYCQGAIVEGRKTQPGTEDQMLSAWGPHYNPKRFGTQDISFVRVDAESTFAELPTPPVTPGLMALRSYDFNGAGVNPLTPQLSSNEPPLRGEAVYFVNYQEQPYKGRLYPRFPNRNRLLYRQGAAYDEPVIYGGIVMNSYGSLIEVATGLKSYSKVGDTMMRDGASGGPVFNGRGTVVGISIASSNGLSYSKSELTTITGVRLPGFLSDKVQLSYIQPVYRNLEEEYVPHLSTQISDCASFKQQEDFRSQQLAVDK